VWILGFVALLPWLLREIPMATLGAVLVVTGWKLVNVKHVRELFHHHGILPAVIWAATLVIVVAEDLLTGVLVGIALSLIEVIPHLKRLKLGVDHHEADEHAALSLSGTATFVQLPRLSDALDKAPADKPLTIDVRDLAAVDHSCAELFREWLARRRARGASVTLLGADGRLARLAA